MSKKATVLLGALSVFLVGLLVFQIVSAIKTEKTENELPVALVYEYVDVVNKVLKGEASDEEINRVAYPELAEYLKSLHTLPDYLKDLAFSQPLIRVYDVWPDSEYWPGEKPVYHTGLNDNISGEKLRFTKGMDALEGTKAVVSFRGKGVFRRTAKGGEVDYRFIAVAARDRDNLPWRLSSVLPYSATGDKAAVR